MPSHYTLPDTPKSKNQNLEFLKELTGGPMIWTNNCKVNIIILVFDINVLLFLSGTVLSTLYVLLFFNLNKPELDAVNIPILYTRKLKHRNIK